MAASDEPLPLAYTPAWIALGIITMTDIHRDEQQCATGDDPHPEHYRWRAFSRFLDTQPSLTASLAHQLYTLGATDPDRAMGGSMMAAILRHQDCPPDLLNSALDSGKPHLQKIATQRLSPDDQSDKSHQ